MHAMVAVAKRLDSPLHLIMPNWAYFMTANGKGYKQDCDTMRVLCVKVIAQSRCAMSRPVGPPEVHTCTRRPELHVQKCPDRLEYVG